MVGWGRNGRLKLFLPDLNSKEFFIFAWGTGCLPNHRPIVKTPMAMLNESLCDIETLSNSLFVFILVISERLISFSNFPSLLESFAENGEKLKEKTLQLKKKEEEKEKEEERRLKLKKRKKERKKKRRIYFGILQKDFRYQLTKLSEEPLQSSSNGQHLISFNGSLKDIRCRVLIIRRRA